MNLDSLHSLQIFFDLRNVFLQIPDNYKGGFRGGARGAEAPPSRFIAPLSKFLLAERGTGKSCSSVSLVNLCLTATVEEGAHRSSSSCKKVR